MKGDRVTICLIIVLIAAKQIAGQQPGLVLPVGHTSSVSSALFSADGKFIVTASWDNTAKIWQTAGGRLLYDLKGHKGSLTMARYSPDGRYILTASKDSTAMLWNALDGRRLAILQGHKDWLSDAVFSRDGRIAITASWDHTIKTWQLPSGRLLHTLYGHTSAITKVLASPDNRFVVSVSKDHTACIWDIASGRLVKELKGHSDWVNDAIFTSDGATLITASQDKTAIIWRIRDGVKLYTLAGHTGAIRSIAISRDNKTIVTGSADSTVRKWILAGGLLTGATSRQNTAINEVIITGDGRQIVSANDDGTVSTWATTSLSPGKILTAHTGPVNSVCSDNKGELIISASADNTAITWDPEDGQPIATLRGHTSVVTSATYSPDGKYMVTASWDNTARIWDAADGRLISELKGHTGWINAVAFSRDGTTIATASSDNSARLWTVPEGKLIRQFNGHSDWVSSVAFSNNGQWLLTASWDQSAIIWNIKSGEDVYTLTGHHDVVRSASFSPDDKQVLTASWDNSARIWSTANGQTIAILDVHHDKVRSAGYSRDGRFIVTSSWDSTAAIWSTDGKLLHLLRGHEGPVNTAIFSPDDKMIVTTSMDSTLRIWDAGSGTLLRKLRGHQHSVNGVSFSPDGKFLLSASWDNSARIWEASSGRLLQSLQGHSASLKSASYDASGKFVVTASEDNTLKKWDASTGRLLYTFFAVDSADYLAFDEDGHYDGTEAARDMLYYVCGREIVDLEQFKNLSWEPGLVTKLSGLNNEPITAKKISDISLCNYTPVVEQEGSTEGTLRYRIQPRNGGLGSVQIFVNGKMISSVDPASLQKRENYYVLQVTPAMLSSYFIPGVSNSVMVKASTREGSMFSRGVTINTNTGGKPAGTPNMYVLAIGVSRYRDEKISLKYASGDAASFLSLLRGSARKLLNTDGREHVFTWLLNTDSAQGRWPLKSSIKNLVDTLTVKVKPEDIFVVFFAGHGVMQAGQRNLYLLTAEATNFEPGAIAADVSVSTNELREWLRKIRANKQLLVLDACNSGQAVSELQELIGRRGVPADQQRALETLKDNTGTFILSASAPGQSAYETSLYGQGLLTYSLLAGVKLGAALKNNRFIDVTKWFGFACDYVRLQARDIGIRQDPQILGTASFDVGLVDRSLADSIQLPLRKKIFRRSRFIQDEELLNDDLEFSYAVDQQLNNLSESGKQSPLVFVAENQLREAYSVRGKYTVADKKLTCRVSVFNGTERVYQFDATGSSENKDELAAQVVQKIALYFNNTDKPAK